MNIDQHHIKIRERSFVDLADLTIRLFVAHFPQLLLALLVGVAPFYLLNMWLFRDMIAFEPSIWWDDTGESTNFIFWMACLCLVEAPLVTFWMTLYLGHWAFGGRPQPLQLLEKMLESLPQLILFAVILRPVMMFYGFTSEVILLERTPLRAKRRNGNVSTFRRLRALHWGEKGEIFGHGILNLLLALPMIAGGVGTIIALVMMMLGQWGNPSYMIPWIFPPVLWLTIGFFTVMRFLSYLNLRIRHEGWDVELAMRVERAKMTGGMS